MRARARAASANIKCTLIWVRSRGFERCRKADCEPGHGTTAKGDPRRLRQPLFPLRTASTKKVAVYVTLPNASRICFHGNTLQTIFLLGWSEHHACIIPWIDWGVLGLSSWIMVSGNRRGRWRHGLQRPRRSHIRPLSLPYSDTSAAVSQINTFTLLRRSLNVYITDVTKY